MPNSREFRGPYLEGNEADAARDTGQAGTGAERDTGEMCAGGDHPFEPDWTLRPGILLLSALTERGMAAETFAESSALTRPAAAGLIDGHGPGRRPRCGRRSPPSSAPAPPCG